MMKVNIDPAILPNKSSPTKLLATVIAISR